MAKNTLTDLNNHLFAQLERLSDEDLEQGQLQIEMERSKAISNIARDIISTARITLDGTKFIYDNMPANDNVPDQFKLNKKT